MNRLNNRAGAVTRIRHETLKWSLMGLSVLVTLGFVLFLETAKI